MAKFACCVPHCRNYKGKAPHGTAWHAFPKNEVYRAAWIAKIAKETGNFHKTKHSRVCSNHFVESDYRPHLHTKLKLLKRSAVPSVFLWKIHSSGDKTQSADKETVVAAVHTEVVSASSHPHHNHHLNNNGDAYADQHLVAVGYEPPASLDGQCTLYEDAVAYARHCERGMSPAPSDTYELTELTPMIKREQSAAPPVDTYGDHLEYQGVVAQEEKERHDNHHDRHYMSSCFDEVMRKCVISETFLFTMLRLIKCPQCGFGTNPEQMHKYENQGCLLGVRLMCYHGHLVIDWRL